MRDKKNLRKNQLILLQSTNISSWIDIKSLMLCDFDQQKNSIS